MSAHKRKASKPSSNQHLLIVSSNAERQTQLQAAFHKDTYSLTFCATLRQAIIKVQSTLNSQYEALLVEENILNQHDLSELKSLSDESSHKLTPIILLVNNSESDAIRKGIDLGMYFYLIYPTYSESLNKVVFSATKDLSSHLTNFEIAQPLLQKAVFHVQTVSDAHAVAAVLSYMTPDPKRTSIGLFELLLNSIEHGNLGIGYDLKSELIKDSTLQSEIERRLSLKANKNKFVAVTLEHKADFFEFTISDNGAGFNYAKFLAFEEDRAMDSHGRGIMIANLFSFD